MSKARCSLDGPSLLARHAGPTLGGTTAGVAAESWQLRAWLQALAGHRGLVGARAVEHCRPGLPEDLQVEGQRPVFDVTHVKPDRLVPGQVRAPADLPQTG